MPDSDRLDGRPVPGGPVRAHVVTAGRGELRRVPADRAPATSGGHDERMVHPQRHHGRSADRGRAFDLRSVETPGEVILPALLRRVEQGRRFLRERVDGANGIRLELVARSARQADVIEGRPSATRCWCDVIIRQRDTTHGFAREAVAARPSISGIDLCAQRLRNPSRHDLVDQAIGRVRRDLASAGGPRRAP